MKPRKIAASVVLAAIVTTPWTFYVAERNHRDAAQRTHKAVELVSAVEAIYLRHSLRELRAEQARLIEILLEDTRAKDVYLTWRGGGIAGHP